MFENTPFAQSVKGLRKFPVDARAMFALSPKKFTPVSDPCKNRFGSICLCISECKPARKAVRS